MIVRNINDKEVLALTNNTQEECTILVVASLAG